MVSLESVNHRLRKPATLTLKVYTLANGERGKGGGVRKGAAERKQKHVCAPRYIFMNPKKVNSMRELSQWLHTCYNSERFKVKRTRARRVK